MTGSRERPWYADGLRFECTQSGNCCSGEPGTVRVSSAEVRELAVLLGVTEEDFLSTHTYELPDGALSLHEHADGDCVFLDDGRSCRVHRHRPRQCRTWPFWRSVVASRAHWDEEARDCPGMNRGPLHDAETIRRTSEEDGTSGVIPGVDPR